MDKKQLYFKIMHFKDRLLLFTDGNKVVGGVSWVLTNNPSSLLRENIWSVPKEDNDGKFIYLDRCTTDRTQSIFYGLRDLCRKFWRIYPDKKICWHSRKTGKLKEIGHEVFAKSS